MHVAAMADAHDVDEPLDHFGRVFWASLTATSLRQAADAARRSETT